MPEPAKLLTSRYDVPDAWTLAVAERHGAYKMARRAFSTMRPEAIQSEVKDATIRGRGGAGFPAGVKWGFLPKDRKQTYLVVNCKAQAHLTLLLQEPPLQAWIPSPNH